MFSTILLPIDSELVSDQVIDAGLRLAEKHNGKLVVLSVTEPRLFRSTERPANEDGELAEVTKHDKACREVENISNLARLRQVECETVVLMSPMPSMEILAIAEQYACDVILMASRGNMGVVSTILGESQTLEVLKKTTVPVLVYPV